ncbi:MAG: general secretion pathway protein GspK [Ramlibacter sp.]|nr:general secretion pathway protein GspK [Ramlibacter sp.]
MRTRRQEGGYVLALCIAVLALLLIAATFVGQSVAEAVAVARLHRDNLDNEIRIESARSRVLFLLATAPRFSKGLGTEARTVTLDGRAYAMGDGILVSLQDIQGLVSLNGPSLTSPSVGRIERLLGTYGVDGPNATNLAEALLDYRDPDNLRRLNGAEDAEYSLAGKALLLRNKNLLDPLEVSRVYGWSGVASLWASDPITNHVSAQKGTRFNPNVADWRALVAMTGVSEEVARDLAQKRRKGEIDDISGLVFAGGFGDPFGANAFVTTFPAASILVTIRAHHAQWGFQYLVHHVPTETASPWRVESVRRVSLPPVSKPYAEFPELPNLKALGGPLVPGPIKLPF